MQPIIRSGPGPFHRRCREGRAARRWLRAGRLPTLDIHHDYMNTLITSMTERHRTPPDETGICPAPAAPPDPRPGDQPASRRGPKRPGTLRPPPFHPRAIPPSRGSIPSRNPSTAPEKGPRMRQSFPSCHESQRKTDKWLDFAGGSNSLIRSWGFSHLSTAQYVAIGLRYA